MHLINLRIYVISFLGCGCRCFVRSLFRRRCNVVYLFLSNFHVIHGSNENKEKEIFVLRYVAEYNGHRHQVQKQHSITTWTLKQYFGWAWTAAALHTLLTHSSPHIRIGMFMYVEKGRERERMNIKNKHQRLQNQQPKMKQHNRIQITIHVWIPY